MYRSDLGQWEEAAVAGANIFSKVFGMFGGKKKKKGPPKILNERTFGNLPAPYEGTDIPDISGSYSIPPNEGPYGGTVLQDGPYLQFNYEKNVTGGTVTPSQAVFTGPNTLAIQSTYGTVTGVLSGSTITWSNGVHFYLGQLPSGQAIRSTSGDMAMLPPNEGMPQIFSAGRTRQFVPSRQPDYTPWLIGGGVALAGILLIQSMKK